MPQDDVPQELSSNQKRLVTSMTSVFLEYYGSTKAPKEDVEKAVAVNVEAVQELMGSILAEITIQQNKKMDDAIAASDNSSSSPY